MALKTPARRGARAPRLQRDTCSGTPAETRTCGRAPGFAATARGSARPTSGGGAPGRPQARGRCGIKRFGRSARLGHACGPSPGQCPAAWGSGSHRLLARTFWGPTGCRARVPWDRGPWQPGGSRGDAQAGIPGQALVTLQGDGPFPAPPPSLVLRTRCTACALDLRDRSRLPGNRCGPRSYPSAHAQRPSHALRV